MYEKISSHRSSGFNVQKATRQCLHIVRCTLSAAASPSTRLASHCARAAYASARSAFRQGEQLSSSASPPMARRTCMGGHLPSPPAYSCRQQRQPLIQQVPIWPAARAGHWSPASASVSSRTRSTPVACQCLCGKPHALDTGRLLGPARLRQCGRRCSAGLGRAPPPQRALHPHPRPQPCRRRGPSHLGQRGLCAETGPAASAAVGPRAVWRWEGNEKTTIHPQTIKQKAAVRPRAVWHDGREGRDGRRAVGGQEESKGTRPYLHRADVRRRPVSPPIIPPLTCAVQMRDAALSRRMPV